MCNSKNARLTSGRKKDFIEKVCHLLMTSIQEEHNAEQHRIMVKITHERMNRCIRFTDLGRCMIFWIHRNGNVSVELQADSHDGHQEQLFEYVDDEEAQAAFLHRLKGILSWLFCVFMDMDCFTYHTYMQYVEESGFISDAHEKMVAEYKQYYGKKSGNSAKNTATNIHLS